MILFTSHVFAEPQRVIFQKMSPHETLFRLETTQTVERALVDHTPLCRFTVWDFPGDDYGKQGAATVSSASGDGAEGDPSSLGKSNNSTSVFAGTTSLVFVVDAQDEPYDHVLQSFTMAVSCAFAVNPQIAVEVFINKVDGELFLSDEAKYDCRRDVMTQVSDELTEAGIPPDSIAVRYHLTSIYDHSIYEALSRVVQRLIPKLPVIENLLNVLTSACSMEKSYLFDVVSKLYISTDSGPVGKLILFDFVVVHVAPVFSRWPSCFVLVTLRPDSQSVELCSDMIDVVLDVSGIYGLGPSSQVVRANALAAASSDADSTARGARGNNSSGNLAAELSGQSPSGMMDDDAVDPDSAYDTESASVIRLSNGMVLYLKEVDTMLALVCITRLENFRKKAFINYNIGCLKDALRALVQKPAVEAS
jgi:Ras-related GTP-binding protein C/D